MFDEILTIAGAAQKTAIGERTIRDAITDGELKGYRRATQILIMYSDLVEWVKKGEDAHESKGKFKKLSKTKPTEG